MAAFPYKKRFVFFLVALLLAGGLSGCVPLDPKHGDGEGFEGVVAGTDSRVRCSPRYLNSAGTEQELSCRVVVWDKNSEEVQATTIQRGLQLTWGTLESSDSSLTGSCMVSSNGLANDCVITLGSQPHASVTMSLTITDPSQGLTVTTSDSAVLSIRATVVGAVPELLSYQSLIQGLPAFGFRSRKMNPSQFLFGNMASLCWQNSSDGTPVAYFASGNSLFRYAAGSVQLVGGSPNRERESVNDFTNAFSIALGHMGLTSPPSLACTDTPGQFYVADPLNHRVVLFTADGKVRLVAGSNKGTARGDNGPATAALLSRPVQIAYSNRHLYIVDIGDNSIRDVSPDGNISTLISLASGSWKSSGAVLTGAVTVDNQGSLYFTYLPQGYHNLASVPAVIAKMDLKSQAIVQSISLSASPSRIAQSIAVGSDGTLYYVEDGPVSSRLLRVSALGTASVISAGGALSCPNPDPWGLSCGLALDSSGSLWVVNSGLDLIENVGPNGALSPLFASARPSVDLGTQPSDQVSLGGVFSLALDPSGGIVFAAVSEKGLLRTDPSALSLSQLLGGGELRGSGALPAGAMPAASSPYGKPWAVVNGPDGFVYFRDQLPGGTVIRKTDGNVVMTVTPYLVYPDGTPVKGIQYLAVSRSGELFFTTFDHRIAKATTDGQVVVLADLGTTPSWPAGLIVLPDGSVIFADPQRSTIRKIATDGTIQTIAGTGDFGFSGDGGPALKALMSWPVNLTLDDKTGKIYVADMGNSRIRVLIPRTGADGRQTWDIQTAYGKGDRHPSYCTGSVRVQGTAEELRTAYQTSITSLCYALIDAVVIKNDCDASDPGDRHLTLVYSQIFGALDLRGDQHHNSSNIVKLETPCLSDQ